MPLLDPRQVLTELRQRNGVLFGVAVVQIFLLVVFLAGIVLDPRMVGGEPVWLKPAKFAASIAVFAATLGWIGEHLPVSERLLQGVSTAVAITAFVEIGLIGGQSARGVGSHFNDTTVLDYAIYVLMGAIIITMTVLVAVLLARSWRREFDIDPAFAWGIRLGIALFVVGAFEGGAMVVLETNSVESGRTIPVLGWSLIGDFRVAHFVGLHALQVLPFVGYLAALAGQRGHLARPVRLVMGVGAGYALILLAAFALAVVPLLG